VSNKETIDSTIASLKDMRDSLGDLSELMEGTQQVSDGLLNSFKDFATAGSSSTLWSAVSRFTSGIFPGFWSLQNKIRSVAVYMQYVEKKQKEQIKKEGQIAKTIDKQSEVRMKAFKKYNLLRENSAEITDKLLLREDKYFKVLESQVGFAEAKLKYEKQFKMVLNENIDGELAMSKVMLERIRNDKDNNKFYKQAGLMKTAEMDSVLYFREKEAKLIQDVIDLEESFKVTGAEYLFEDSDEFKQLKALKNERDAAKQSRQLVEDRTGLKIVGDNVEKTDTGKGFKGLFTAIPPYLKTAIMSIGPIGGIIKTMSWLGKKGNARLFRDNAMKTGMFLGKFLLYISLLGLVIFLIHKSGIIQYVIETLKLFDEWAGGTKSWFAGFWDTFKLIFTGIFDFFSGLFTFFYGAFTGDSKKFMKGLKMMGSGLIDTFTGVVGTLVFTAITILVATIGSAGRALGNALMERAEGGVGGILGGIGGVMAASRFYKGAMAGSRLGPKGALVGALVTGFGIDKAISYGYDKVMGKNASGGLIQRGGNYLVGEAGPEIINLPAGANVIPNNQMRGGGQVVNVYVNGRLGASDRELNEIGRKVGIKINREINKSNNIGVTLGSKLGSAVGRMI
tara:strand:- start:5108 stop:6970 length:1863 start_codon:yes stop_codon:yes gene_type:complete